MKEKVQKFGRILSAMVMPNIAVFIAWGLITAFFIPTGWLPNELLASLVDPMNKFLLPTLIGYTSGYNVYGQRGAIVGAIMTIGVLVGAPIPMFIGAMVAGPLGAYLIKKIDKILEGKAPQGFEMLVNNFSAGILGFILAIIGCLAINPACILLMDIVSLGVEFLVRHGLLPLLAIIVEPAKILFLNNAINHGVFSPIGIQEALETGKSLFFLIESNPGPGLGILLAYTLFGKGNARASAPGAAIIHLFGGIHEIYFPYVLMQPALMLAAIVGGATGIFTNVVLGGGLVAPASPGSILAILSMTNSSSIIPVVISVVLSTIASFIIAMFILKVQKVESVEQEVSHSNMEREIAPEITVEIKPLKNTIKNIVFACDAGMGSSAMGAAILTKKLKAANIDITVPHYAINDIPLDAQVVVTQISLVSRVEQRVPNAIIYPISNFMAAGEYDHIIEKIK